MNKKNGKTLMRLSKETLVYEVLVTNDRLEAMASMLDKAKEAIKTGSRYGTELGTVKRYPHF